ncbi:MAG: serine/threonine-protein kinase [Solirubrobacterales bacterium]
MVGERILSRFTLEERLGSGGFGTVYRAWDERLQRAVAVKVIESGARGGRVLREAQAAARLGHPGIVTLYELAREDSRAYLVTELVEGGTVAELSRRGELSDSEIAGLGAEACEALAHAHAQGVVHRDVKPQNILVAERPRQAKLVDFGIARLLDEATMTASGDVLGTLAYMAPEQAEGRRPGPAADVYSLSLTLYETWAGEHPLLRGSAAATARAIGEPVPSLAELRPDLPAELVEEIDAALEPDPERRPSAARLGDVLERWSRTLSRRALPPREADLAAERRPRRALPRLPLAPLGIVALYVTAIAIAGEPPNPLVLASSGVAGLLALARPRLAVSLAAAALAVWVGTSGHEPVATGALAALAAAALARSGADIYQGRGEPTLP